MTADQDAPAPGARDRDGGDSAARPRDGDGGDAVRAYHQATKHHFHRFARSLGYLDWAAQPKPFRHFAGAATIPLFPRPEAEPFTSRIGALLRYALGLSAWKSFRDARWALRVNPSSGNLHPTEAYVVTRGRVWHYAPDVHALEERCRFDQEAWTGLFGADVDGSQSCLIVLTSIAWREAWKYGERAFQIGRAHV